MYVGRIFSIFDLQQTATELAEDCWTKVGLLQSVSAKCQLFFFLNINMFKEARI